MEIKKIVDEIFFFYETYGNNDYIGEEVTQIEHMVQSAMLAENDCKSNEIILAAFLHDIGHLIAFNSTDTMGGLGATGHENIGAEYLRSKKIIYPIPELVCNHVKGKRYLTYKYADYYNKLSDASKKTLEYQGGPMNQKEAEEFEKDPLFKESLKMREYDDKSKIVGMKINNLKYYKKMLINYLSSKL